MKVLAQGPDGKLQTCAAEPGEKLLAVLQKHGVDLEGACEGSLACATCHVVVDAAWYGQLPPPNLDENDMLDLAPGRAPTSRLSCQLRLTAALDGLQVRTLK